jgi:hypothetical protein
MTDSDLIDAALALLTLVTGDNWDRDKLAEKSATLQETARKALIAKGLTKADAATFVEERWAIYAAQIPLAEPLVANSISAGVTIGTVTPGAPSSADLVDRAADYRRRKALASTASPDAPK